MSWRGFFTQLEHLHGLDVSKPSHLWLLQVLFLKDINDDCQKFQQEWNAHPISGPQTNDKSPNVRDRLFVQFLFALTSGLGIATARKDQIRSAQ
jgi:hypothetical protein